MIIVRRLLELALRMGNKMERILDDNQDEFTLQGISHSHVVS